MKDQTLIYGIRAVLEALEAGKQPDKILVQQGLQGPLFASLRERAKQASISLTYVPAKALQKYSGKNHQGVVAQLSPIPYLDYRELIDQTVASDPSPLFLLLDGVTDVRNLGAMIRTAVCTGVNGLILPAQGSAPITADTIKTSAGAVFHLPVARAPHLKDVIYYLQACGIRVAAATEKTENSLFEADLKGPLAILMGSEGRGIHPSLLKVCDTHMRLPMKGSISSLNVSVACGVVLYEVLRQREGQESDSSGD